jgi:hypothetical protein
MFSSHRAPTFSLTPLGILIPDRTARLKRGGYPPPSLPPFVRGRRGAGRELRATPYAAELVGFPDRPPCDFCRSALSAEGRHRLVWRAPAESNVVLADLCSRCANRAERLIARYGGLGHDAIGLESRRKPQRSPRPFRPPPQAHNRALRLLGHGGVYVLIGLVFFVMVTLLSSQAH